VPVSATIAALRIARERGVTTIFNPAPALAGIAAVPAYAAGRSLRVVTRGRRGVWGGLEYIPVRARARI
jgi:sugar/nucleoside kinase (ribokinase family)